LSWLLVVASLLAYLAAAIVGGHTRLPVLRFLTVGAAVWASFDSGRIQLRRYRAGEAAHPVLLFWGVATAFPIWFPWYLLVRRRVLDGRLQRGPAFLPDDFVF